MKLEKLVNFSVPTWSIFAGQVTFWVAKYGINNRKIRTHFRRYGFRKFRVDVCNVYLVIGKEARGKLLSGETENEELNAMLSDVKIHVAGHPSPEATSHSVY